MKATPRALGLDFPPAAALEAAPPVQTLASAAPGGLPSNCCGQNHPALRMTVGTLAAGAAALGQSALGLGRPDPEVRDARRAICGQCEFARGDCVAEWLVGWLAPAGIKELGCCQRCRCYLWAKTDTASARCPEGKW